MDSLRDQAVDYGKLHHVCITTFKSSVKEGKITLHCKQSSSYRAAKKCGPSLEKEEKEKDIKRRSTSTSRLGCSVHIYARRDRVGSFIIESFNGDHGHPLATDDRTYAVFRKMESNDMETAIALLKKHLASEVLKILNELGVKNVIRTDLENIKQVLCKENDNSQEDTLKFVIKLQSMNCEVRYRVDDDNKIISVFFIQYEGIEEVRRLPESIVLDATYKTNSYKMVLLNFVIAGTVTGKEKTGQLTSIPIAGCWMTKEAEEDYIWALWQFRDIVWGGNNSDSKTELPSVFVSDNDQALRNALGVVFPEASTLICYLHVARNFEKKLISCMSPVIKRDEKAKDGMQWINQRELNNRVKEIMQDTYDIIRSPKVFSNYRLMVYLQSISQAQNRVFNFMKSFKHRENKRYTHSNRDFVARVVIGTTNKEEPYKLCHTSTSRLERKIRKRYRQTIMQRYSQNPLLLYPYVSIRILKSIAFRNVLYSFAQNECDIRETKLHQSSS